MSLKTNSRTVFRLFGAGVKSFRLTCKARQSLLPLHVCNGLQGF